jgi:hypothetical protein
MELARWETFPKTLCDPFGKVQDARREAKLLIVDDVSIRTSLSPIFTSVRSPADVMITCPECLRTFPQVLGEGICLIHETGCVHCRSLIQLVERGDRRGDGM